MQTPAFHRLSWSLSVMSSRRVVVAAALASVLSTPSRDAPAAKHKKKPCPPCKQRKKGKCKTIAPDGTACSGGTCQGGSCIPPADPVPTTTADAACPSAHASFSGLPRNAQTFRALRSGQLTSASVELHDNVEGADFDMEI